MAKMRSPNYPAMGLGQAIEAVRVIWAKDQRTPVAPEVAAKHLGYGGLNGIARMKLSALKKFGLLEEGDLGWRVSDLGMKIIHGRPKSDEYSNAVREAAMRSDLFRKLASTHAKASDDALRSYLLVNEHFSEAGARQFIEAFRNTLKIADISDVPDKTSANDEELPREAGAPRTSSVDISPEGILDTAPAESPNNSRLVLEVPFRGTRILVQIRVSGDSLRAEHIARVRKYLAIAEEDLGSSHLERDDDQST